VEGEGKLMMMEGWKGGMNKKELEETFFVVFVKRITAR
jgi:hypothetical protein